MKLLLLYLVLTFIGPLIILLTGNIDFKADWRTANRESSNIAPLASQHTEAIIQVYAARTFNWRGLFSVHMWLAVKPQNAKQYTVIDVVGWRLFWQKAPLGFTEDLPDRLWFNQKPKIILDIRGEKAEKLIPEILTAAKQYPYKEEYHYWPGPNSNTFLAYIGREVPALQLNLPSNAVGKDFLTNSRFFARAPSGTGYQFSVYGLFGLTLARKEGIEINILGLDYGIGLSPLTIKLPGIGNIPT